MGSSLTDKPGLFQRVANLRHVADLPRTLMEMQRSGGPVTRADAGPYPIAYVGDKASVQAMLDARFEGVAERGRFFRDISKVVGPRSLVTSEGVYHRRLRRMLAPAFRREQVGAYAEKMAEVADQLSRSWREGQTIVVNETMARLALEIAARALFGLERAEQLEDFTAVLSGGARVFYRLVLPGWLSEILWRNPFSLANRRLFEAQRRVDRFVEDLLTRAGQRLGKGAAGGGDPRGEGRRPANLLDVLLSARDDDGAGLSPEELRDQVVTFFFAGHETTAQALTWTFVSLAREPEAERRLHDELQEVLGGRIPSVEDLPRLTYLSAVVRESLRLHPPAWFLSRETTKATSVAGCPLPQGALLLASPLALHRDPSYWSEPDRFCPARWLGEDDPETSGAYLPFGYGRRNCIGSVFAVTEMMLAVGTICARWRIRVEEPEVVRERATVTLRTRSPVRGFLEAWPS